MMLSYSSPDDAWIKRQLIAVLELLSGRSRLEEIYNEIVAMGLPPNEVWETALRRLDISVRYDPARLMAIPESGPLVVISNHPFGIVDGLIICCLVSRVRPAFVLPVNAVLYPQQPLAPFLLPIDFNETRSAARTNIRTRREILARMNQGEALVIFPAGGISTARKGWGRAEELEWKRFTARVVHEVGANVLPVFVHGQNSRLFQMASSFSQTLRLGLLLHEIRNKVGMSVRVTIGEMIPYASLEQFTDRDQMLKHLRTITCRLAMSA